MGKKPVMALAGLCLASTAIVGCCGGSQSCRPQQPTYHTSPTWSNNPAGQNPQLGPPTGTGPGASGMPGTAVGGMQQSSLGGPGPLGGVQTVSGVQPSGGMQPGGMLPKESTGLQPPITGNSNSLPGRGADSLGNAGGFGRPVDDTGMNGPMPPAPPAGVVPRSSSFGAPSTGFGASSTMPPPAPPSFPATSSGNDPQLMAPPPIMPDRNGSQVMTRPMGVTTIPSNPAVMTPASGDAP